MIARAYALRVRRCYGICMHPWLDASSANMEEAGGARKSSSLEAGARKPTLEADRRKSASVEAGRRKSSLQSAGARRKLTFPEGDGETVAQQANMTGAVAHQSNMNGAGIQQAKINGAGIQRASMNGAGTQQISNNMQVAERTAEFEKKAEFQKTNMEMIDQVTAEQTTTTSSLELKINVSSRTVVTTTSPAAQSLTAKETVAIIAEPICQKCNEIYDDPRLLNCLHSFCSKCLHAITAVVGTSNVIRCPICKDTTPIPADGIDNIQVNLFLEHESTIATIEVRMKAAVKPACEECSREPVRETVSFCCTCVSFLCELCHKQHIVSRKSHLHHKVLKIDDTTDIKAKLRQYMTFIPTTCPIHIRQEIAFFCKECKILVCVQCALSKHPGHRVEDLLDFVKRQKNVFCEDVREMPEMITKLDDLMNSGKIVCDNIKTRENSIEDNINKVFTELHKSLDLRKAALLQQCTEIATSKLECLTDQIEALSLLKSGIITCNEFVATSKEHFDVSEFISVLTTLHKRIEAIKGKVRNTPMNLSENDVIHFNSDATAALNCISAMGSVFVLKNQDYSSLHDPISTVKTSNAYHVAVHRSGEYVVANHIGDCMEVYESTGNKKLVFGRNGTRPGQFKRPLGVSIVGDIIYIVEYTGSRCQKMTINGEFLCEIGAGQMTGGWGCAVSKNGVLYVAEESNNRVQAFTPDGKTLKILCSSPIVYAPRDVAIDCQGKIHIAACGSKCIKVLDSNGTFIREYGNGVLLEPSGVAVDQLNFCFVADWAGKSLHVFDPTGKHVNKVEFEGCISGVTIDNNNHVHVVNHSAQTISMY